MTFHDLKDLVMIYGSTPEGKVDYTWDKADIVVWDPEERRNLKLIFTGSERPNDQHPGKIHFNISTEKQYPSVPKVFNQTMKEIFPSIDDDTLKEYSKIFLSNLLQSIIDE